LHVYNGSGEHAQILNMIFDTNGVDFHADINSTSINTLGLMPYIVWCNNTQGQGGYYSGDIPILERTNVGTTSGSTFSIAIVVFLIFSTILIFSIPKLYGTFSESTIVNTIITRCCYIIGFYLMVLNSAVVASIADAGYFATSEIFRYMWLFGTIGYLLMFVTGIKTLFDVVLDYKNQVKDRRGLR